MKPPKLFMIEYPNLKKIKHPNKCGTKTTFIIDILDVSIPENALSFKTTSQAAVVASYPNNTVNVKDS